MRHQHGRGLGRRVARRAPPRRRDSKRMVVEDSKFRTQPGGLHLHAERVGARQLVPELLHGGPGREHAGFQKRGRPRTQRRLSRGANDCRQGHLCLHHRWQNDIHRVPSLFHKDRDRGRVTAGVGARDRAAGARSTPTSASRRDIRAVLTVVRFTGVVALRPNVEGCHRLSTGGLHYLSTGATGLSTGGAHRRDGTATTALTPGSGGGHRLVGASAAAPHASFGTGRETSRDRPLRNPHPHRDA